jgi:hypothetical protein
MKTPAVHGRSRRSDQPGNPGDLRPLRGADQGGPKIVMLTEYPRHRRGLGELIQFERAVSAPYLAGSAVVETYDQPTLPDRLSGSCRFSTPF